MSGLSYWPHTVARLVAWIMSLQAVKSSTRRQMPTLHVILVEQAALRSDAVLAACRSAHS